MDEEEMIKLGYNIDTDGNLVNKDGQLINMEGKLLDSNGNLIEQDSIEQLQMNAKNKVIESPEVTA